MKRQKAVIGYDIYKKYGGKGNATEAGEQLLKFAFETLELEKVIATCDARNVASETVMKKLGMTQEGRSRNHEIWKNGEWIDMLYYAILKDDYFKRQ